MLLPLRSLWFALSKETSPLIVVIHHSPTGDHTAFYFYPGMSSARIYNLGPQPPRSSYPSFFMPDVNEMTEAVPCALGKYADFYCSCFSRVLP